MIRTIITVYLYETINEMEIHRGTVIAAFDREDQAIESIRNTCRSFKEIPLDNPNEFQFEDDDICRIYRIHPLTLYDRVQTAL